MLRAFVGTVLLCLVLAGVMVLTQTQVEEPCRNWHPVAEVQLTLNVLEAWVLPLAANLFLLYYRHIFGSASDDRSHPQTRTALCCSLP